MKFAGKTLSVNAVVKRAGGVFRHPAPAVITGESL